MVAGQTFTEHPNQELSLPFPKVFQGYHKGYLQGYHAQGVVGKLRGFPAGQPSFLTLGIDLSAHVALRDI